MPETALQITDLNAYANLKQHIAKLLKQQISPEPDAEQSFENEIIKKFETFDLEAFLRLSNERRASLMEKLEMLSMMLTSSVHSLSGNRAHFYLRLGLKKFGWKIDPSVFELIDNDSTIEIYGCDFVLKVANMRFLQVCSYSLEEALGYQYFELFQRDPRIALNLQTIAKEIIAGKRGLETQLGDDHLVTEAFSLRKNQFWIHSKVIAPVFSKWGSITGFLYSASVTPLAKNRA